jgi:nucleotide-binding universal stress UspA family protein
MKTILVPIDFSDYALPSAQAAVQIALRTNARIVIMHNVATLMKWESMADAEQKKYPETLGKTIEAGVKMAKFSMQSLFKNMNVIKKITHGIAYESIASMAKKTGANLIVMGSHGNEGSERYFIGSTIQKVMREVACPVMLVKKQFSTKRWKRVVFAANFDEDITRPFLRIKPILKELDPMVYLLYVNTPYNFKDDRTVLQQMNAFMERHADLRFTTGIYNQYDLDAGILEYAGLVNADCICMVTHKHKHAPKYLISVTESVVYHSQIPVLSVTS